MLDRMKQLLTAVGIGEYPGDISGAFFYVDPFLAREELRDFMPSLGRFQSGWIIGVSLGLLVNSSEQWPILESAI
jgi:hypothetical protein